MIQVIVGETMAHRARMTEMEIVKSNLGITYSSLILFQHGSADKYHYRAEGKKWQDETEEGR